MNKIKLSLVLPCYNEAEHFEQSSSKILSVLKKSGLTYEIIFVDDASLDKTKILIKNFLKKHQSENCIAIFHIANTGRGKAVSDGFFKARGEYVGFMDIDCEVSPEYIPKIVKMLDDGFDMVSAHRHYQTNPSGIIRAIGSTVYLSLVQIILTTRLADTEAGYKFAKREKIISLLKYIRSPGWFWDTEIMIRAERNGFKIGFIPVLFIRRHDKTSTVHLFSDSFDYFIKLIIFRLRLSREFLSKFTFKKFFVNLRLWILPINKINQSLPKYGLIYEIGSGQGVLASQIADFEKSRQVIGLDLDANKIKFSKERYKQSNLEYKNVNALKYLYKRCFAIVLSDFLHHLSLSDQEKLLKKVMPKIKTNGAIIIKEINKNDGIRTWLSRFWDLILYPSDKINYRSKNEWIKLMENLGFYVSVSRESYWFPGSTWIFVCRKK